MAQAVGATGLVFALWVACATVGSWILPRRDQVRPDDAIPSWNQPGVAACIGLGVLLALGGIGIAVHLPVTLTAGLFLVVGLAGALIRLANVSRHHATVAALAISGLTVGAFVLMALVESRVGLRAELNPCDELRAYLPMVHRLLDTNAVVEPWSYRRVQNLGGFTYLQAIPVRVLGDVGIGLAEFLVGAVFLGGLFVATGFRATWTRIACLLFILSIPLLWIPRINLAPVLFAVPLLIAAFAATAELRRALGSGDRNAVVRWSIGIGVLLAAIASVRLPNLAVAGATVAIGALTVTAATFTARLRSVAIAAGTSIVAITPWLLASWESVGTPLYPLITGNSNTSVPSERDPAIDTLGELASNALRYLRGGSIFWVALAVLVFALIARKRLPDPWLLAVVAITTLASILLTSVVLSVASLRDFGRYVMPLGASLAVFAFAETLRALDPATRERDRRSALAGAAALGLTLLGLGAVFTPLAVRTEGISRLLPGGWSLLHWSSPVLPGFERGDATAPAARKEEWRRVLEQVDPDHTIVAVDRPYLIDYEHFDLPSMDLPGWATPTGAFPFFKGPEAKVDYLLAQGFTQLVVTDPVQERCLQVDSLRALHLYTEPPDSTFARYYLDWVNDLTFIEDDLPRAVTRYGTLRVIDLTRARTALRARDER